MNYLGIDLGRKTSAICAVDHRGKPLKILARSTVDNRTEEFVHVVKALGGKGKVRVTLETGNCAFIYARKMIEAGADVYVVNPYQNALIRESRKKNDGRDALQLTEQRRKDMLPKIGVYVPSEEEEAIRRLHAERAYIVKQQTSLQNRTIRLADRYSLYFENGALKWKPGWQKLLDASASWPEVDKVFIATYYDRHNELARARKTIEEAIQSRTSKLYEAEIALLNTIKGVGDTTAGQFMARVCSIKRFATSRALCAYAGLTPISRQSGKKRGSTAISKAGDAHLRGLLLQAADSFARWAPDDDPLKQWYGHLSQTRGWYKARVALARKLVSVFYGMLKRGMPYDPEVIRKTWGTRYQKT